jgi:hypothetical protein
MKPAGPGIAALALLALLAGACAQRNPAPNVNLGGYPPAFRDGYVDGCNSARSALPKTRDETRFRTDAMYASGWRDGHDICTRKKP